jgi:hypothetical protein
MNHHEHQHMDRPKTALLLALCAAFDQRTLGEADVEAWHAAIGDLAYEDSRQAVIAHYRESRERIMPADVRQRVTAIRKARLDAAGPVEIPEELADRPNEAVAWKQRVLEAIASGRKPHLAIRSGQ